MNIAIVTLALLCALVKPASAHELQANRATLVLRDHQHLALTLFVDYPKVLHQVLAPKVTLQEFLLTYSAMQPADFQAQLTAGQRLLQGDTRLEMGDGKAVALVQWVWPTAASVQKLLKEHVMKALVAPNDHVHAAPMEIRAEAKSNNRNDFRAVSLRLPAAMQQVLVVSYAPAQIWLKPNTASPTIRF